MHHEDAHGLTRLSLAGLLCLLGALVLASCSGSTEVTIPTEPVAAVATPTAVTPTASSVATPIPTPPVAQTPAVVEESDGIQLQNVLFVLDLIPRGTSAQELIDASDEYFSVQSIPVEFARSGALESVDELQEFLGLVIKADLTGAQQLRDSSFAEPGVLFPSSLDHVPQGHDLEVLSLSPSRSLGGFVAAGDITSVIATQVGPDGDATSTLLLTQVEVLHIQESATLDGPQDPSAFEDPENFIVTVALTHDEAFQLAASLERSAIISLTFQSTIPDEHVITIEMPQPQALDGDVDIGDLVNVVALGDPDDPNSEALIVASGVDVLALASTDLPFGSDDPSDFTIVLSVTEEELLAVASAVETSELALERPQ